MDLFKNNDFINKLTEGEVTVKIGGQKFIKNLSLNENGGRQILMTPTCLSFPRGSLSA